MYSTFAISKVLLALLLVSDGVDAFAMRGQGHLRNATSSSSTTLSPTASTSTTTSFVTEAAIFTPTALPSSTAASTLSSVTCGPTPTFIIQAISPDTNVSGQYIYSASLESGDTLSLTTVSTTATRFSFDSLHGLITEGLSKPLYATSAIDNSYGPVFMDSADDMDQGALHENLVFTINADDMLVIGDGRPGVLQVEPLAVSIGYATLMVHTELRVGYAGIQARVICVS